jgi:hypothetical protein
MKLLSVQELHHDSCCVSSMRTAATALNVVLQTSPILPCLERTAVFPPGRLFADSPGRAAILLVIEKGNCRQVTYSPDRHTLLCIIARRRQQVSPDPTHFWGGGERIGNAIAVVSILNLRSLSDAKTRWTKQRNFPGAEDVQGAQGGTQDSRKEEICLHGEAPSLTGPLSRAR